MRLFISFETKVLLAETGVEENVATRGYYF